MTIYTCHQGQEALTLQRVWTSVAQVSMQQVLQLELDEVPTHVRSEHQLEWACGKCCTQVGWSPKVCSKWTSAGVSLPQVLHLSWMKSQLMFEVNIARVSMQWVLQSKLDEYPTVFEVNTSRSLNWPGAGVIDSSVGLDLRARVRHSKCCDLGEVPMGCLSEPPVIRSLEVRDDRQVP